MYENQTAYVVYDLAWTWRSFISFRAFQMQNVFVGWLNTKNLPLARPRHPDRYSQNYWMKRETRHKVYDSCLTSTCSGMNETRLYSSMTPTTASFNFLYFDRKASLSSFNIYAYSFCLTGPSFFSFWSHSRFCQSINSFGGTTDWKGIESILTVLDVHVAARC